MFVIERENKIWFGGEPRMRFADSGLFRVGKRTGEYFAYGPRDGFKLDGYYKTYGVWVNDQLWIATHKGLAVVTRR
ncbi:MAG: hypothetical protein R3C05_12000 [Pirellulaceae bacterium]